MIEIEAPDGSIVEFPDGTPDETINAAMRKAYPSKQQAPAANTAAPNADLPIFKDPTAQWEPTEAAVTPPPRAAFGPSEEDKIRAEQQAKTLVAANVRGTQAALSGVNDALFLPANLAADAANIPLAATDALLRKSGTEPTGFRFERPGDIAAQKAFDLANSLGLPVIEKPQDLPFWDRLSYNVPKYGAEALTAGTGLAVRGVQRGTEIATGAAPKWYDELLRAYRDNASKAVTGDAVAGMGAGTGLSLSQAIPDAIRNTTVMGIPVGPAADFMSMLLGGVAGGTTATAAMDGPQAVARRLTQNRPVKELGFDAEGNSVTRALADRVAAYLQKEAGGTEEAADAANSILRNLDLAKADGRPIPTAGLIAENTGMANVEKTARMRNPTPFQNNDKKLHDFSAETLQSVGPADANPRSFTDALEQAAAARRTTAQEDVTRAQTYADRVENVRQTQGSQVAEFADPRVKTANANIVDQTYVEEGLRPLQQQKNQRYNAIDPGRTEIRPTDNLVATATRIEDEVRQIPEALRGELAPQDLLAQIRRTARNEIEDPENPGQMINVGGTGEMAFGDMNTMRRALSAAEQKARSAGQFGLADSYRALRGEISGETRRLATENSPAGLRAAEADRFYNNEFAPFRGEGPGDQAAKFRKDFNKDPANRTTTPPSQTVERFVQPNQPEKAESLRRGLDATPNAQRGVQATGDWVMGELAETSAIKNGKLTSAGIDAFERKWGATFDAFPEAQARIRDAAARARKGELSAERFAEEVQNATSNLRNTEAELNRGAFKAVIGNDPKNAVRNIFGAGDPERTMADTLAQINRIPDAATRKQAADALKRAAADHMLEKVMNVNPAVVSEGNFAASFARLTRYLKDNEKVLAAAGFSPEEMNALRRAHKAIEPLAQRQGQATVGSPTAENTQMTDRMLEVMLKGWYGGLKGGNVYRNVNIMRKTLFAGGTPEIDLVNRVLTNPELAAHLLTRKTAEAATPAWNAKLAKLLRYEELSGSLLSPDGSEEKK